MTKTRESATRAADVHARLREDILSGQLEPGSRLKSAELCDRYACSVGATREALSKLEVEGLVRGVPNVGYMVTPLTRTDLIELTEARVEIESLVLGLSIESGDVAWEGRALAAFHVLERTPFLAHSGPVRPSDEWAKAHTDFHVALLEGCENSRLFRLACTLRVEAGLYQLWSVSFQREPERNGVGEHRAILDACLAHDVPLARRLLAEHLEHTTRLLLEHADVTGLGTE